MSRTDPANVSHSIRQRLLNLAKDRNEDPNLVFIRYAIERLLYRLGCEFSDQFVLKGAMLFNVWTEKTHRPTRDLDLLGFGSDSQERLKLLFQRICQIEVEPDGLVFDSDSIKVAEIREEQEYPGQRVKLTARLGTGRINIQIDIGFGDAITPQPQSIEYPTLLDLPAPHIQVYPRETVVAEKLQAMVALGMLNSRMKDFYDLWVITKQFSFDGKTLTKAVKATFDRRATIIPNDTPTALSDAFATDTEKNVQWKAFLNRSGLAEDTDIDFQQILEQLRQFLLPPLWAAANNESFNKSWTNAGPWV